MWQRPRPICMPNFTLIHPPFGHSTPTSQTAQTGHTYMTVNGLIAQGEPFYKRSPKTAAPIEMPFGLRTLGNSGNHVLDDDTDPPWEGAIFGGRNGRPIVKYRDTLRSSVQKRLNRSRCRLGFGLGWAQEMACLMGCTDAEGRCQNNQFLD